MTDLTISDLPDERLLCRRGGLLHSWQPNSSAVVDGDVARMASFVVPVRCDRCGKEKFVYLDAKKQRIGQYYREPEGYLPVRRANGAEVLGEIVGRSLLIQRVQAKRDGTVTFLPVGRKARPRKRRAS